MTSTIILHRATAEEADAIKEFSPYFISGSDRVRRNEAYLYTLAVDSETNQFVGMVHDNGYAVRLLFVLPEYRRRGIATMLIQKLWDENMGAELLWIISPATWPILEGIRRKIKNVGMYSYEMLSCFAHHDVICKYYLSNPPQHSAWLLDRNY